MATTPGSAPTKENLPGAGPQAVRPRALSRLLSSVRFQSSISFLAFVAVFFAYYLWLGNTFTNVDTRSLDIHQNAPVLLLGLAVLVTLIAGQFDLSVASMATLTTYLVIGLKIKQDWPFGVVILACLAIGLLGGLLNGLLVVKLRVNTFIATLGTAGVFGGLASVYGKGSQLSPTSTSPSLPGWFSGSGSLGDFGQKVPVTVIWIALVAVAVAVVFALRRLRPQGRDDRAWTGICVAAVAVVALLLVTVGNLSSYAHAVSWTMGLLFFVGLVIWVLLDHTTFGRYLHAIGSNVEAARLARIDPGKETIKAFVLGGFLAGLAGIILGANQGAASPEVATSFLLPAFGAAFLSTVILSNGRFNVWGTLIGGIFLIWVSQGLIVGGVPFTWTDVVNGFVLILAVALSTALRRRESMN